MRWRISRSEASGCRAGSRAMKLRHVPELHFHYDDSVDRGERIDALLRGPAESKVRDFLLGNAAALPGPLFDSLVALMTLLIMLGWAYLYAGTRGVRIRPPAKASGCGLLGPNHLRIRSSRTNGWKMPRCACPSNVIPIVRVCAICRHFSSRPRRTHLPA